MPQSIVNLSKSAQKVQQALAHKGLELHVIELPATTRTALEAAAAIGCEVAQIAKSLVFKTANSHQAVFVLASGANQVDTDTIAKEINERVVKADADFTKSITGFAIGGIPPIGHAQEIPYIFIDEDLMQLDVIWAAAGTPNAVFRLSSHVIPSLLNGKIIKLKKQPNH